MGARGTELFVLCLFCSGIFTVYSATMQASFSPKPAIVGPSNQHTVQCSFSPGEGEMIQTAQLLSNPGGVVIANLFSVYTKPLWSEGDEVEALKARGVLFGTLSSGRLSMILNDTRCSDKGTTYMCRMTYYDGNRSPTVDNETTLEIQAGPGVPEPMTPVLSEMVNVTEFSPMTFTCRGNVGMPAGNFSWFTTVKGSGNRYSVTPQAGQSGPQESGDGCTFTQNSSLTLNLTRTEEGQPLEVLCMVNQVRLQDPSRRDCLDPSVDFCRRSVPVNVLYPVHVGAFSQALVVQEGANLSVPCMTSGNPRPHLVEWRREGENETLATDAALSLRNVNKNDSGSYVCTAYNVINGVTQEASETVVVSVVKMTTPAPTTTPKPTPAPKTTPSGDSSPNKAGLSSDDITIVVVVLVALVVIVAIIVIVVIIRRRRSQKQLADSPEKGVNHQPEVNTIAMQPEPSRNSHHSVNSEHPSENNADNKNKDGLMYADLQFDNKPRSRRPLAIDDSHTEYADISMPQV